MTIHRVASSHDNPAELRTKRLDSGTTARHVNAMKPEGSSTRPEEAPRLQTNVNVLDALAPERGGLSGNVGALAQKQRNINGTIISPFFVSGMTSDSQILVKELHDHCF